MEYLQYLSISRPSNPSEPSFKPYYKWNTFNTTIFLLKEQSMQKVLNLIINGIPSILSIGRILYDVIRF